MFAKLYDRNGWQVLVTLEEGTDDGPAVRVSWKSRSEMLDICSAAGVYQSAEKAKERFSAMTEELAFQIAERNDAQHVAMFSKPKRKAKGRHA